MKSKLPNVLKELRTENKLTQKEIAAKINVSQRAYAFYEKGEREPSIETLTEIAKFYKVSIDYIVGFTDNKISLHKLNKDEQQVLEIYNGLSERNKGKLELYAEQLQEAEAKMKEIG